MLIQLLVFILLFFLFAALLAIAFIKTLLRRSGLSHILDMLRRSSGTHQQQDHTIHGRQQQQQQRSATPHGDVIIDRRSPEKAQQKIFSKEEGEYVDYKEE